MRIPIIVFLTTFFSITVSPTQLERVSPEKLGLQADKLSKVDDLIRTAIHTGQIPGAVIAVVKNGKMAYVKAYGNRQLQPTVEKMDIQTIFDLASCTKPLATAISVMQLLEQHKLDLQDNVSKYIPEFIDNHQSKNPIKIIHLLTHTSGLPSYVSESLIKKKYGAPNPEGFMQYIDSCKRNFNPGTNMEYSCLNYISLQHIVEKITQMSLRDYTVNHIYLPLGLTHTDFILNEEQIKSCAPCSKLPNGTYLKGIVHDPLARVLNAGISGNAGLFSTIDEVAVLVAMLQNGGEWNGVRILNKTTVEKMIQVPSSLKQYGRSLGWDVSSKYASCKGDLLSDNAYCHTGYTGTSIVIDPDKDLSIILLTNRVHPYDKSSVVKLRKEVSNAVAASLQFTLF